MSKTEKPARDGHPALVEIDSHRERILNKTDDEYGQPHSLVPLENHEPHSWARYFVELNDGVWYGDCGAMLCPVHGRLPSLYWTLAVRDGTLGRIVIVCMVGGCSYGELNRAFEAQRMPIGWPYPFGQAQEDEDDTRARVMAHQAARRAKRSRHGH